MNGRSAIAGLILLALLGWTEDASAYDAALKAKAKEVLAKHKDAIVTVKLVITSKTSYMGTQSHKQERKNEVTGTVIDPSGLTVLSNFPDTCSAVIICSTASSTERRDSSLLRYDTSTSSISSAFISGFVEFLIKVGLSETSASLKEGGRGNTAVENKPS